MSTGRGDKAAYSDVKNWYDTFNNLARNYSNGIGTLTVPSAGARISASDINNLHSKINSFRSDAYLGTQAGWWPTGTNVGTGALISSGSLSSILTAVSNASRVKCKNTATNAKGAHNNEVHWNENCSNGKWENGDYGDGRWSRGEKGNGDNWNGTCNSGKNYSGQQSRGQRGNGWNGNGTKTDGTKGNGDQSNGAHGNGTRSNGTQGNGTIIDITCSQATKSN